MLTAVYIFCQNNSKEMAKRNLVISMWRQKNGEN